MRKIAFGYSTRCNVKCEHCIAVDAIPVNSKLDLAQAKEIIQYRKCELCEKLFNSPDILETLQKEAGSGLNSWYR